MNWQDQLLEWYDLNARELPWRGEPAGSRAAYPVWLAEILLQQTQVSRATGYFERFISAFPTVKDLANAPLEAVLKLWEGAGYYARARNLHRAAQIMAHRGIPSSYRAWLELPGVGCYTAAAIASLSSNEAVAAVDGNVRRVLARLENVPIPSQDWLLTTAQVHLATPRVGAWNEALIELGATLCTPKKPRCLDCPIANRCAALAAGTVLSVPAAKPRATVQAVYAVAKVIYWQGLVYLEQRPKNGLLGGMFGFGLRYISAGNSPRAEGATPSMRGFLTLNPLMEGVTPALLEWGEFLGTISHTMTHRQFTIDVYARQSNQPNLTDPNSVALPVLDRKILALLESSLFVTRSELEPL